MTIAKIRLRGLSDIDLPIVGAQPSDLYICKSVDGLGPPEVDVRISQTTHQGGVYQGRNALSREIVAMVILNPNYSIGQRPADLRTSLYGLLTPGDQEDYVFIEIHRLDGEVWFTQGWVKRMEPTIFEKDPAVQIVISCIGPHLSAANANMGIAPPDKTAFTVMNTGTAPTGFSFMFTLTSNANPLVLSNALGTRKMHIDYTFLNGDVVTINTTPGSRSIKRHRNGVSIEVAGYLRSGSEWLMLRGGPNQFTMSTVNYNWTKFGHSPQHWGV